MHSAVMKGLGFAHPTLCVVLHQKLYAFLLPQQNLASVSHDINYDVIILY